MPLIIELRVCHFFDLFQKRGKFTTFLEYMQVFKQQNDKRMQYFLHIACKRLQNCRFQQLDNLPDGLDEGCGHKATADEFEDSAAEQTDKTAPTGSEGLVDFFATEQFAEDGADKWTEDDTGSPEEQSDKHAYGATPHSPARAPEMLGAPCGNNIIKDGDNNSDNAPDKKELPREVHTVGCLSNPQADIRYGSGRNTRHDATDDANEHAKTGKYEKKDFH